LSTIRGEGEVTQGQGVVAREGVINVRLLVKNKKGKGIFKREHKDKCFLDRVAGRSEKKISRAKPDFKANCRPAQAYAWKVEVTVLKLNARK